MRIKWVLTQAIRMTRADLSENRKKVFHRWADAEKEAAKENRLDRARQATAPAIDGIDRREQGMHMDARGCTWTRMDGVIVGGACP